MTGIDLCDVSGDNIKVVNEGGFLLIVGNVDLELAKSKCLQVVGSLGFTERKRG